MTKTPVVKHDSEMDAETFLKHINSRHAGILPGVPVVGKSNVPGDEDEALLRALHRHHHSHPQNDPTHTHREGAQ